MADYYLNSFRVSSQFGENRGGTKHYATDFAGKNGPGTAAGMNIPNIMGGKVIQTWKNHSSIGNGIMIQGSDGRVYRYIHMQGAPKYKVGQTVAQGASLGKVGNTGRSTGAHLDLQIKDMAGKLVDPMKVLQQMQKSSSSTPGRAKLPTTQSFGSLVNKSGKGTISQPVNYKMGYNNYSKINQATKAPGYSTYKNALTKAVGDGKIPAEWAYALTELVGRESSWNHKAKNPNSSARGYGQFIASNVKAYEKSLKIDYDTPYGQIVAMAKYVKDRYGDPVKALKFWDKNRWY